MRVAACFHNVAVIGGVFCMVFAVAGAQAAPAATEPSSSGASSSNAAVLQQILEQVKHNHTKLDAMKARLDTLQKQVKKLEKAKRDDADNDVAFTPPGMRGPDMKKLKKIKLPANPTQDQVMQYINQIAEASANQNMYSSEDPQIQMLAKVGKKHIGELIEALSQSYGMMNGPDMSEYLIPAITRLAGPESKALILKKLAVDHRLVEVVVHRGWVHDAKATLIKVLKTNPQYLPGDWIQAVANFQDPSTYSALKRYFINSDNKAYVFRMIEYLPGIKLDDAVKKAWKQAKFGRGRWERESMAAVAVRYGYVDALGVLIHSLKDESGAQGPFGMLPGGQSARLVVLSHIKFSGTNKQIKAWFDKNREVLQFNAETKMFVIGEGLSRSTPNSKTPSAPQTARSVTPAPF